MTIPVLTPPVDPAYSSKKVTSYRLLRANFGDGYSQRAGDGLNTQMLKLTLDFENMIPADADTLEAFFNGLGGVYPFYYTLPLESSPTLFISSGDMTRTYQGPNSISLNVIFEQVYDISGTPIIPGPGVDAGEYLLLL